MKLVILDRDGVINKESDAYIKSPEEWFPLPGSLEAIARLYKNGYSVVIASNQSGVGRGYFTLDTLAAIHGRMRREVEALGGKIDGVFFCPHRPEDNCDCRKPKTGLFKQIAERYKVDLKGVPMIGDAVRDIIAARSVGGRPILVLTGRGREALDTLPEVEHYADLSAAVAQLMAEIH